MKKEWKIKERGVKDERYNMNREIEGKDEVVE